tara:strand:- start:1934 stop:13873 length:11940 start_codon:yes stop_codon:yes gene_type:complete
MTRYGDSTTSIPSNIYAWKKGTTEAAGETLIINASAINSAYYHTAVTGGFTGNFLMNALYNIPLNPLLIRGEVKVDMADFTTDGGLTDTGVLVNGAIGSTNSTKDIVVDTVDATTKFSKGDALYDDAGALVGTVEAVESALITLVDNNIVTLANNEHLYKWFPKITSYEIHKADNDTLTHATAGINQAYEVKATFTLNSNTTVDNGDTTGIFAGMTVTGTSIPVGATVSSVNANGTEFVLSASATGSGATELTFTTQTYTAVNRVYPNNNTGINSVSEHLTNLEETVGNSLKCYDYNHDSGQRFLENITVVEESTTIYNWSIGSFSVDSEQTSITVLNPAPYHYSTTSYGSILAIDDIIVIDNEEMLITGVADDDGDGNFTPSTLTVIRGYNDTKKTRHKESSQVWRKNKLDSLWVCVYSDNSNNHHFAKITDVLKTDVYGDTIQFYPSLGVSIPKDTKFAIFSSEDGNLPKLDSDNQTLVACAYGLQQTDKDDKRHFINTHVSRPFFYFLNGKDKLEPATRYILRSSSWDGLTHTYTYSSFVTQQEYSGDIIDYGPYTMEAKLVDILYEVDSPSFIGMSEFHSDDLALNNNGAALDTITLTGSSTIAWDDTYGTVAGGHVSYYGANQHRLEGIGFLRDTRLAIYGATDGTNNAVFSIDSATDPTTVTVSLDTGDLSGSADVNNALVVNILSGSMDLDHNKAYSPFDSANSLKNAFRMAHRPNTESASTYYGEGIGHTRFIHYTDSPMTNNIIPNALELITYDSITSTGGYVDIVLADTQKILDKKMKIGDKIDIHQIIVNEEININRNSELSGTFEYSGTPIVNTFTVKNLSPEEDIRFQLESSIPNSKTDVSGRHDPIFDGFTITISTELEPTIFTDVLYHFIPSSISNKVGNTQTMVIKYWRMETDKSYVSTAFTAASIALPAFADKKAYRRRQSFLADNILTSEIPIDSHITDYSLDYNGSSAAPTYRNLVNFERLLNDTAKVTIGETNIIKPSSSRINNVNLVLKGGSVTGHRLHTEYGDSNNKIIKLQPHFKDERFLESYNKTDYIPYSSGIYNTSLYSYPINTGSDGASSPLYRYNLESPAALGDTHVRGVVSYLDYFSGSYDVENKIFSGTIESIEQAIEDGMFKFKVRGRSNISKLLGPIVNKDYKFTEDIVYSTIGPVEKSHRIGQISYVKPNELDDIDSDADMNTVVTENSTTNRNPSGVYPIGSDRVVIYTVNTYGDHQDDINANYPTINKGDLIFDTHGNLVGRIYDTYTSAGSNPFVLLIFEEGTTVRLKHGHTINITKHGLPPSINLPLNALGTSTNQGMIMDNVVPDYLSGYTTEIFNLMIRGNAVSFSKALSSNPYNDIRVNSLSGARDKGIIFTGGKSLSLSSTNTPVLDGDTLIGTSSSSHKLAKGYSISSPNSILNDLSFYCNLSDEVSESHTISYKTVHTVNSLTDYSVINVSSKEDNTIMEVAPICPAIFGRVDENNLDNRDNYLINTGCKVNVDIINNSVSNTLTTYPVGYNGPITLTSTSKASQEFKTGDWVFTSEGNGLGKIVDINRTVSNSTVDTPQVITIDRPLTEPLSDNSYLYKYVHREDYVNYYSCVDINFYAYPDDGTANPAPFMLGGELNPVGYIVADSALDVTFLSTLETGMRIEIQGATDANNNGVFVVGSIIKYLQFSLLWVYPRDKEPKISNYHNSGAEGESVGVFAKRLNDAPTIKVLNNTRSQSMYFLNTQGLPQGGVLTLLNNTYSRVNKVDNIMKPIRFCGPIFHYITDNTIDVHCNKQDGTEVRYNPMGLIGTGVLVNETLSTSDTTITVDGIPAVDGFEEGDYVYNSSGVLIGQVSSFTNATTIVLYGHNRASVSAADGDELYRNGRGYAFSDYISRYGNTKWRYFALQKGKYLSYINRRKRDGKIKETYTSEKGRVGGYAKAYRIPDSTVGNEKTIYPYGFHNNDFSWGVSLYDAHHNTYKSTFEFLTESNARLHPYFLENLSPESRDFRPVFGSNFADFTKHGTRLMGNSHIDINVYMMKAPYTFGRGITESIFQMPRYMPRMHDNFRGGDWQWDMDAPVDPPLDGYTLKEYSLPHTVTKLNYKLNYNASGPTYTELQTEMQTAMSITETGAMMGSWIQLGGHVDKNNNRAFRTNYGWTNSGGVITIKLGDSSVSWYDGPYLSWGECHGNDSFTTGTSLSDNTVAGKEFITKLWPPYIGPKVDGITRAKDHWELPDPKAQRWFIFSNSDMFPDSMSRQNHIGYSGTVDGNTISRQFTDYNIMLKSEPSTQSSRVSHEYYEGSLKEEADDDDNYEVVKITESSILPSEMKRFGLMRLVDCVYDWHFNLIDPERLPQDMTQLTTPNFEYTRYLPLKKTSLYVGVGSTSADDSFTTFACINAAGSARTPNSGLTFNLACDTNTTAGSGSSFGGNPKILRVDKSYGNEHQVTQSTDSLKVGMAVTGDGIPSSSVITQIDSATLFRINNDVTATQTDEAITFGVGTTGLGTDVVVGDQLFGYDGRYLGKVASIDTGAKTITVTNRLEQPYPLNSGVNVHYRGPLYTCGDGNTATSAQVNWDSWYHFDVMGRGGKPSFNTVRKNLDLNMLQCMINTYGYSEAQDVSATNWKYGRDTRLMGVPYGAIGPSGYNIHYGHTYYTFNNEYKPTDTIALDTNITNSAFSKHFNEDLGVLRGIGGYYKFGGAGTLVLPPAFRTYYSSLTEEEPYDTTVNVSGAHTISASKTINTVTSDPRDYFSKGSPVYTLSSTIPTLVGVVESTTASTIVMKDYNLIALSNLDPLYTIKINTGVFFQEQEKIGKTINALVGGDTAGATVTGAGAGPLINKVAKGIVQILLPNGSSTPDATVTCEATNLIAASDVVMMSDDFDGSNPLLIGGGKTFTIASINTGSAGANVTSFELSSAWDAGTKIAFLHIYHAASGAENKVKSTYNHPSNVLEYLNQQGGNNESVPSYLNPIRSWNQSEIRTNNFSPFGLCSSIVLGTYDIEDGIDYQIPVGGGILIGEGDSFKALTASKPSNRGIKTGVVDSGVLINGTMTDTQVLTVDTVDARTKFSIDGNQVGKHGNWEGTHSNLIWTRPSGSSSGDLSNATFIGKVVSINSATEIKIDRKVTLATNTQLWMQSNLVNASSLADEKYGDGWGDFYYEGMGDESSNSYSLLGLNISRWGGNVLFNTENISEHGVAEAFYDSEKKSYIAKGVYCGFSPTLVIADFTPNIEGWEASFSQPPTHEGGIASSRKPISYTNDNRDSPIISVNNEDQTITLRIGTGVQDDGAGPTAPNNWLNFVDLTGFYLVANKGYKVGEKTFSFNNAPYNGSDYDIGLKDDTGNYTSNASKGGVAKNIESRANITNAKADLPSMNNVMIDPMCIHYIKEHKRNITGDFTAHEITIDNINGQYNAATTPTIFGNYRIMRPAETCFWKNSPTKINLNTLSSQTTKMPQDDTMYPFIPSLQNVNANVEYTGPIPYNSNDNLADLLEWSHQRGEHLENEGIMSMYLSVDMDARKSQNYSIGDVSITNNTNIVTGTNFLTNVKEGDALKISDQISYVSSINSNTSLTIMPEFVDGTVSNVEAYVRGNLYPVLRDTGFLFTPDGNRNTFKNGVSYNMFCTDGQNKQKMSMSVEADYWAKKASCQLSFGVKFTEDMLGLISLGEIFTIKSNVPIKSRKVISAKIGSTVVIGNEVEDIIEDLISNENIHYDSSAPKEYPYYIAPNYQGVDILTAGNFAAKYKNKQIKIDANDIYLIKQESDLDLVGIELSYKNEDLKINEVTRSKSTFDLYNEITVYGNGVKSTKINRKSIEQFGKKSLEDVNMELFTQDDVDSRAKGLLSAHSSNDDRFSIKMSSKGIEFIKSGDILTLDFPEEGVTKGQYKVYEITRQTAGLVELEVGTYRKDLANRFAELMVFGKSNAASIRGNKFKTGNIPLDFFDKVKLKELRLVIRRIGLVDADAFTLGFQTNPNRLLDFGTPMQPQETEIEIITDEDLV